MYFVGEPFSALIAPLFGRVSHALLWHSLPVGLAYIIEKTRSQCSTMEKHLLKVDKPGRLVYFISFL
ncbi:MAG TPA: hypothetical protein DEP42_00325 [Ruminococcaceae bacterium]|nr:hypothetical protein [Oscillospiraceae bacterium]